MADPVTRRPEPAEDAAGHPGVTIIDLDRTLTRRGTYSPFLLHVALRSAPHRLLLVPGVLLCMLAYRLGLMPRSRLKVLMQAQMMGRRMPRPRIEALASSFADRIVDRGLCPGAGALIERERSAGRVVLLATAAHRFYAEPIAHRLGIRHVVATESEWRGDVLTPRLAGENCYGRHKLDAVSRYLIDLGWTDALPHRRFYSDDASDLATFEWSDQPIAVNPSRRLARIAARRGWPALWLRATGRRAARARDRHGF